MLLWGSSCLVHQKLQYLSKYFERTLELNIAFICTEYLPSIVFPKFTSTFLGGHSVARSSGPSQVNVMLDVTNGNNDTNDTANAEKIISTVEHSGSSQLLKTDGEIM